MSPNTGTGNVITLLRIPCARVFLSELFNKTKILLICARPEPAERETDLRTSEQINITESEGIGVFDWNSEIGRDMTAPSRGINVIKK
jgi:hypothetical protein